MTERLYYNDSMLLEFEAEITQVMSVDGRQVVLLDRTAFYPTSGGQSHDTGRLGEVRVIDVIVSDDGDVWHITDQEAGVVGTKLTGRIDRERRLRNSQNHTAQHLLSAAFAKLYNLLTVSVHLGEEYAAVELESKAIDTVQLERAEAMVNEVVRDNIVVETLFVDSSEAAGLPLRKPPPKEGRLRVIRMAEFECSACGGTHCQTTGGVGLIKITGTEKIRGNTLVKFLTGKLAFEDYKFRFEITDRIARDLTCHPVDLPGRFKKLRLENKELRGLWSNAQKELLPLNANQIASRATLCGAQSLAVAAIEPAAMSSAPKLAGMVADQISGVCVLLDEGRMVVAVSENGALKAGDLAKHLVTECGLKGGGNQRLAQLGGASIDQLDSYRTLLEDYLSR